MTKHGNWMIESDQYETQAKVTLDTGEVLTLFTDGEGLHVMLEKPRLAAVGSCYGNGLCIFPRRYAPEIAPEGSE